MGLFDIFKKDKDFFKPKACISGKHEFVARVFHEAQCVPTIPQIHYVCQKCGVRYYGDMPLKYGVVIDEKYTSSNRNNKHFCENCGKETEFINPFFCSVCGHKRSIKK